MKLNLEPEDIKAIAQEVVALLKQDIINVISGNSHSQQPDLMNYPECAEYLNMAVSTLRKAVMNNEVPHIKKGKPVLFSRKEIDAWLTTQKVPASRTR